MNSLLLILAIWFATSLLTYAVVASYLTHRIEEGGYRWLVSFVPGSIFVALAILAEDAYRLRRFRSGQLQGCESVEERTRLTSTPGSYNLSEVQAARVVAAQEELAASLMRAEALGVIAKS